MSKIVMAVNAMIDNKAAISQVVRFERIYFFLYDSAMVWSIEEDHSDGDHDIWLSYFPESSDPRALKQQFEAGRGGKIPSVSYSASSIGTREAEESFSELHTIVKERVFGIDSVLDKIIGTKG